MPHILITCNDADYVQEHYVPALLAGGWSEGIRMRTPKDGPGSLGGCRGILLSGGLDIHPSRWNPEEVVHPTAQLDPRRDEMELNLLAEAWKRGLPILGICRGAQILNVARGGSLIQHLPDVCNCAPDRHKPTGLEKDEPVHSVRILRGSRLHELLGVGRVFVNSRHHQAVQKIAPGMRAVGFDPETRTICGPLVEAIESLDPQRWVFGVQWHPENQVNRSDATGAAALALFWAFCRAATQFEPESSTER